MNVLVLGGDILSYTKIIYREVEWLYRAYSKHPEVKDCQLWIKGMGDWPFEHNQLPIHEKIIEKYGDPYHFQLIVVFTGCPGDFSYYYKKNNPDKKTAIVLHLDDDYRYMSLTTVEAASADIVTYISGSAMLKDISANWGWINNHTVTQHYPLCVDKEICYVPVQKEKPIDVLLIGSVGDGSYYPMRRRFADLIESDQISATVVDFPGFNLGESDQDIIDGKIDPHTQDKSYQKYIETLSSAKILLVGSGKYGYPVPKYQEGSAAGCLVIGNIPRVNMNHYKKFVVEVNPTDTDEKICETVKYWLANDDKRIDRAKLGQNLTLNNFTWDHMVDSDIKSYEKWKQSKFEVKFPEFIHSEPPEDVGFKVPDLMAWYASHNYCSGDGN